MPDILLIETATSKCSVALMRGERICAYRESEEPRAHAAMTAVFIDSILKEQGLKAAGLDAVCVSAGPGSYTGLRVGSSSAKGICFGAGIPLLSVSTLDILAAKAIDDGLLPEGCKYIVPMVDARRMEVYSALYSPEGKRLGEIEPDIVEEKSFAGPLGEGPVLFIGDGAGKCREVLAGANAHFAQCCPDARAMLRPTLEAWNEKRFENTAYFEPFYLKQYVATVSKKKLF